MKMFRNIQDRMVHTEKEAREMAEPEDQVGSGDGKQGVIWRDQLVVCFPCRISMAWEVELLGGA